MELTSDLTPRGAKKRAAKTFSKPRNEMNPSHFFTSRSVAQQSNDTAGNAMEINLQTMMNGNAAPGSIMDKAPACVAALATEGLSSDAE